MVQKQIYIAAKKHNIYYVYELQKYLINSNEAKLVLIKNIIDKANIYWIYAKNYDLSSDKNMIYKTIDVIFHNYLLISKNLLTLNIEVKNKLLYLSILPVCKAKLKDNIFQFFVNSNDHRFCSVYGISNLFNNCNNIKLNNNFIQIIINKLQSSKSINRLIIDFLYSGYIHSSFNVNFQQCLISKTNEIKNLFISSYSLINLIFNILFLDKSWFFFKTQLKKINTQNLKRNVYKSMIGNVNNVRLEIINQVSSFIYDRIHNKFRLIRKFNYRNKFIDHLISIYLKYCKESKEFLFLNLIKKYNEFINVLLYTYQKKMNNFNAIKKIINLNHYVNLYINYYNIVNFESL
uniref:Group II intron reverse transcriptase maturase protein n=1 Tax=Laurencia australis TaxID=3073067 RepID=A0AA51NED5_9FLOR|nr:Group II intron reverse transcriptase maturase protein [Laurencia australis]